MLHICNTLGPRWNGRCFADDISKCTLLGCIEFGCRNLEMMPEISLIHLHWLILAWSRENYTFWYYISLVLLSLIMMTSPNGNIFRVTGSLWGESTGHRWIPLTKASDMELLCFLWSTSEQTVEANNRNPLKRHRTYHDVTPMAMQHVSFIRFNNNSAKIQPTEFILIAALI